MVAIIVAAAVVVLAIVSLSVASRTFYRAFARRAAQVRAAAGRHEEALVSEADLSGLPEPLARYLRFSGVVGKRRISWLRLLHSGQFKPGAARPWAPIKGEYSLTTKRPSFTWYGKIRMAPGLSAAAIDGYFAGEGSMRVKILSLVPLVDSRSPETTQSAFGRCLVELLAMAPSFALDRELVQCTQVGPNQVRCEVADGGLSGSAELFVNDDGSLDRVEVMRYYDRGDGQAKLERFTGKGSSPRDFGGLRLSSRFDGTWNLAEGDLHYVAFTVDEVQHD